MFEIDSDIDSDPDPEDLPQHCREGVGRISQGATPGECCVLGVAAVMPGISLRRNSGAFVKYLVKVDLLSHVHFAQRQCF